MPCNFSFLVQLQVRLRGPQPQQSLPRMVNVDLPSLERALDRMVKAKYYSDGNIDPEGLAGSRKLLIATGEIKEGYDFEHIIDRRFIPE